MEWREFLRKRSFFPQRLRLTKICSTTKSNMSSSRPLLQVLQPLAVNRDPGKPSQAGKGAIPKRKQWLAEQNRGLKRVKMEVKSTQTEDISSLEEDAANEAYELMIKETPPPAYWKAIAEERRKALFNVLQENEKLHKDIEAKDERISRLKSENEELRELADHVEYMADVIERLTGKGPENLEELKGLALDHNETQEQDEFEEEDASEVEEKEQIEKDAEDQTLENDTEERN
ncbi:geminin isoform X1 [Corythoichthys intestinalis]|uniref:geminin isoform X1 n=1 Tax=Corythoichthys intestinalis TaxID=161448 RepID=UPI0025A50114|nr:geminin isoform X1 [Corythoichthys intestinalis]